MDEPLRIVKVILIKNDTGSILAGHFFLFFTE